MIFKLNTAKYFFSTEDKAHYEKMGFKFKRSMGKDVEPWIKDEENLPAIIFDSAENLKRWHSVMKVESDLIISFEDMEITIYDEYME